MRRLPATLAVPSVRTFTSKYAANALVVDIFLSRKYDQMTGRKAVPTACATKIKLEIETLSYSEGSTYLSSSQNCRALWGWESNLILLILFCVGFGHAYTLMTYAYSFSNVTSRDGLGVFLCLALLSWILALSILFRVLKAACGERSEKTDGKRDKNDGKERQNRPTVWKQLYAAYEMIFEINGNFYLIKKVLGGTIREYAASGEYDNILSLRNAPFNNSRFV